MFYLVCEIVQVSLILKLVGLTMFNYPFATSLFYV